MKFYGLRLVFLLALVLGGCAPSQVAVRQFPANPTAGDQSGESLTQTPFPNSARELLVANTPEVADTPSAPFDMDKYVGLAKQDLADRLKVDADQIALVKTMEITWPDISLGCSPGSGQILTKGQVHGYRVWLEAEGQNYIYHVGLNGQVILCPKLNPGVNNPRLSKTPNSNLTPQSEGK
jgi:hypothetical protein